MDTEERSFLINIELEEEASGRFRDLIHSVALGFKAIGDNFYATFLRHYSNDTFTLLINPSEGSKVKEKIKLVPEGIMPDYCDSEERERKGILREDIKSGVDTLIIMRRFDWKKN